MFELASTDTEANAGGMKILLHTVFLTLSSISYLCAQTQTFSYDTDGRLQAVQINASELDYSYDAEGNMVGSVQDQDGDTLSDEFEQVIIDANPSDSFSSFADVTPEQDFDGDGFTNGQEFAALSFPADNLVPAVGLTALLTLLGALYGFMRWQKRFETKA